MIGLSEVIIGDAEKLLLACKNLDYSLLAHHDAAEVSRLKQVLSDLSIVAHRSREPLEDYANEQGGTTSEDGIQGGRENKIDGQTIESKEVVLARMQLLVKELEGEGFGGRVGRVYNSFASDRSTLFKQVPHRRGLPPFDLVLSADYAPVAGMHGVFVTDKQLMSIILPADTQPSGDWQILKTTSYQGVDEMVEKVTLIAAGFDLP